MFQEDLEEEGDRWRDNEIETKHGDKAWSNWNPHIKKYGWNGL